MAIASALIACGGNGSGAASGGEATSGGEYGEDARPVEGDICAAVYDAETDVTEFGLELSSGLAMGAAMIGDDWQIRCSEESDVFFIAQSDREDSFLTATISLDRGAEGAVELEATANAFRQGIAQAFISQGAENLRMSDPEYLSEDSFFIMLEAAIEGVTIVQVNLWKLLPSPIGLFRMHATYLSRDPELLVENVEAMGEGVTRFQLFEIEERD